MIAIKSKNGKFKRFNLDAKYKTTLTCNLKHDRQLLAGKNEDYNPNLGNRCQQLNKQITKAVIMLVLSN